MNLFPKNQRGFLVMNIEDADGRIVLPNAVFVQETRYRFVGFGSIPSSDQGASFTQIDPYMHIGTFNGAMYIKYITNADFTVRSKFSTHVEEYTAPDGHKNLRSYKKFDFYEGVEDKCSLSVDDCQLIMLIPYQPMVRSNVGNSFYAFLKKDNILARIPLPNSYADGAFCIGKGVEFDELPPPVELVKAVHRSFMEDEYNSDLSEHFHRDMKWYATPDGYHINMKFDDCPQIINEKLLQAVL